MEGNEIEKAAEEYAGREFNRCELLYDMLFKAVKYGANWQKERENAELTRANARIEELEKMIDLYRKANGQ